MKLAIVLILAANTAGADSMDLYKRIEDRYDRSGEVLSYDFGPSNHGSTKSAIAVINLVPDIQKWLGDKRCGLSVRPSDLNFKSAEAKYVIHLQGGEPQKC